MYHVCGLGGVETSIINKMEAFRSQGVEVRALFQSLWGEGGELVARHPDFFIEANEEAQKRFISEWTPDLIIVIDTPRFVEVVDRVDVRCPLLFETHMSELEAFRKRRVLDAAWNPRVSRVIVPSEFNRAILAEQGFDSRRIHVIANPIDIERFRPTPCSVLLERLGLPKDRHLVLFVGRLEPQKNPLMFVRVCAELLKRDSKIHGVVLGDAVNTAEYAACVRADAASIKEHMTFIPRASYDEMPSVYTAVAASGGCLISTSLHESQPMIVLEAMACGCPVVSSDVGGVREIIKDAQTGSLYQLGDVQAAVSSVMQLLNERDQRGSIVSAAMDYVRSTHPLARTVEAYISLLDEVSALSEQDLALREQ